MNRFITIITIGAGISALFLIPKNKILIRADGKKNKDNEDYIKLINQLMGDRDKAERLISYEKQKNPRLTREQCIKVAADSHESDIRRWD